MNFFDVIKTRRSIRKFSDQPVEKEKIDQILSATLRAPSSRGSRSWEFVLVDDSQLLNQLSQAKPGGAGFLKTAPLAIVVCVDPGKSGPWIEDATIAALYIQLSAQALYLGSCWAHFRDKSHSDSQSSREYIAKLLDLPPRLQVECAIAIGYPDEEKPPYPKEELPFDRIKYNKYSS